MRKKKERIAFEKIEVLRAGARGKAVGKAPDGRAILLSNAIPGDVVDVLTTKKRKSYFEGVATRFHKRSEKRTEPVCIHFGLCGGCKWQDMGYEHQLAFKEQEVADNLQRIGHLAIPEIAPIIGSKNKYFYRNKLEFSFSDSRWLTPEEIASGKEVQDRHALGFHIPGMWDKVLDIETCHLQQDPSNAIRLSVKEFAIANNLSFFNLRRQEGLLRSLMIRTASTGEIMVLLQFFEDDQQKRTQLMEHIASEFPEITSLQYVVNQKSNDSIYDQDILLFSGRDYIVEAMEGLRFRIHAKSFYQTNSDQAYELYKITRDFASLSGKELVYDLYTGTGTIAQFIAPKAAKVIGIEAIPDAIKAAKANAEINGLRNVDFFSGDMKEVLTGEFIATHGSPDVVITDPPREGMHKDVIMQLLNIAPKKIVYVSCNTATQARDLALMQEVYRISRIQPVDMFPQTHHVENVVLLEKISEKEHK
jgi:23S rRNA (uracil1939-C5)-methyltransferase